MDTATRLPILMLHSIDDEQSVISFPPRLFEHGMEQLYDNGYQTISLLEVVEYLSQAATFPERSFVLTFDDGFETVYSEAFPVLQAYRLSATVFLTVGEKGRPLSYARLPSVDGRAMLSWAQIREMHHYGITFGAHTLTHPDLTRLPRERVVEEVYTSKVIIEDRLGSAVTSFAYPYGRYDAYSRNLVQQYFQCACSDKLGFVTMHSDLYALERVDTYYLRSERLFNLMRTWCFPWYIRARSIPRQWRRAWLEMRDSRSLPCGSV